MTRRSIRVLKRLTVVLGAGVVFNSLTCVRTVADTVGTGLTLGGVTGVLGEQSDEAAQLGVGLDAFADLAKFVLGRG